MATQLRSNHMTISVEIELPWTAPPLSLNHRREMACDHWNTI